MENLRLRLTPVRVPHHEFSSYIEDGSIVLDYDEVLAIVKKYLPTTTSISWYNYEEGINEFIFWVETD